MVTHPSTNRAQCRLTTLIEVNALTTTLRRHLSSYATSYDSVIVTLVLSCLVSETLQIFKVDVNRQTFVAVADSVEVDVVAVVIKEH